MADLTQADLDAAIAKVKAEYEARIDAIDAKKNEAIDEAKKAKQALRASQEIKPEDLTAAEERADKAEAALKERDTAIKALTKERDTAVKALESESGAARAYALEAEITDAIAKGNVVPALVPALKAMVQQQAKAELVDGKYSVSIGEKPARDYINSFLDSDDGKAFRLAANNSGTGAPGGSGNGGGAKTVTRSQFDAMDHGQRASFAKDGGKVIDQAA